MSTNCTTRPDGPPCTEIKQIVKSYLNKMLELYRVANDCQPSPFINSKIMVEWKNLVVILCHDHAVLVD